MIKRIWMLLLIFQQNIFAQSVLLEKTPTGNTVLSKKGASYFAKLSLECTEKDYPHFYQESMEINSSEDLKTPKQLWPSFYGCFDWHSGVHNHWALVKLLKTYPNIAEAGDIKKKLEKSFDAQNILKEVEYFKSHEYPDEYAEVEFEFPYGRSWLLKVADELIKWDNPDAKRWLNNLSPLTTYLTERYLITWPKIEKPEFTGSHNASSLGLSFALDYSRSSKNLNLEKLIIEKAKSFYGEIKNYPLEEEPYGYDFMSGGLLVADLMRKVYSTNEYYSWLKKYEPDLFTTEGIKTALQIKTTEKHDGYESHWDGFHLNRIWCLNGMMKSIPKGVVDNTIIADWKKAQEEMWDYAQASIGKGNYSIDHWLSSFSVFAIMGYQ
jgi:hypothetical protein